MKVMNNKPHEEAELKPTCKVWGFHNKVAEDANCLRYCTMSLGEHLLTFQKIIVHSPLGSHNQQRVRNPLKMTALHSFEISVTIYQATWCHSTESFSLL